MGDFSSQLRYIDLSGSKLDIIDFQPPTINLIKKSRFISNKINFPSNFLLYVRQKKSMAADAPLWATNLGPAYDSTISSIYALGSAFIGFLEHLGGADSMGADSLGGWMFFFRGKFLLFFEILGPTGFLKKMKVW